MRNERGRAIGVRVEDLPLGEQVFLSPIPKYRLQAVVRRRSGTRYGFEFVSV